MPAPSAAGRRTGRALNWAAWSWFLMSGAKGAPDFRKNARTILGGSTMKTHYTVALSMLAGAALGESAYRARRLSNHLHLGMPTWIDFTANKLATGAPVRHGWTSRS